MNALEKFLAVVRAGNLEVKRLRQILQDREQERMGPNMSRPETYAVQTNAGPTEVVTSNPSIPTPTDQQTSYNFGDGGKYIVETLGTAKDNLPPFVYFFSFVLPLASTASLHRHKAYVKKLVSPTSIPISMERFQVEAVIQSILSPLAFSLIFSNKCCPSLKVVSPGTNVFLHLPVVSIVLSPIVRSHLLQNCEPRAAGTVSILTAACYALTLSRCICNPNRALNVIMGLLVCFHLHDGYTLFYATSTEKKSTSESSDFGPEKNPVENAEKFKRTLDE